MKPAATNQGKSQDQLSEFSDYFWWWTKFNDEIFLRSLIAENIEKKELINFIDSNLAVNGTNSDFIRN